ncbi:CAIB/BAIF family CoA transferase [Pokkaliibacter plantistimulans]|uniref:CAIB/BAIF family CoA transferase n=1 Tax=Pokkaliibacter plantistimulans TaxID=1635171 RepID=A0ABX5LZG8_9GAMM|nr:CoA transferase [Pokkaliibacter plantistimulans]PXF30075.1 CAIB/BAIF family CoA transferase [Pokkaliibacter plantistimulans]
MQTPFHFFLRNMWLAAGGDHAFMEQVQLVGEGQLASPFAVTELASGSIAAAGLAIAEWSQRRFDLRHRVQIDQRLASLWFATSLRPQGWQLPPAWDAIAGDYPCKDGWIRLHTNAAHHRHAALQVLGCEAERDTVAAVVAGWYGAELESAIVQAGGCAAQMRSSDDWAMHAQGTAVQQEPVLHRALHTHAHTQASRSALADKMGDPSRPFAGIKVLDLTRILAGPIATRFLAGFGADVLRIDPPDWDEVSVAPEVTLGKRCARLDVRKPDDRHRFEQLLAEADVLIHGYRPEALERLGMGASKRRELNPALVDICLDAYGWTGPWSKRRGFDSLVQMSSGIAEAGMRLSGANRPQPLPVQALDHATGYLLATAAIRGLTERLQHGVGCESRASLARTARLLLCAGTNCHTRPPLAPEHQDDLQHHVEQTSWGPARRLQAPLRFDPVTVSSAATEPLTMRWDYPAGPLGSANAAWVAG